MSCRRATETDLLAFAADRLDPEWASFRAHYPTCPDCAKAVAGIGALVTALAEHGSGAAHPDDDLLLDYEAGTLGTAERSRVDAHLAGCAACRTEVAVLRGFAPEAATAPAGGHAAERRRPFAALLDRLSTWLAPGPAFALTAALLALAVAYWSVRQDPAQDEGPRYADQAPPSQVAPDAVPRPPEGGTVPPAPTERETSRLAEGPAVAPPDSSRPPDRPRSIEGSPAPTPAPRVAPGPSPEPGTQLAQQAPPPSPSAPESGVVPAPVETAEPVAPGPDATGGASGEREVVLLAALLPSEMPHYADPTGLVGDDLDFLRSSGVVRGGAGDRPALSVLAPERLGLTQSASPRLYWAVDRAVAGPVEVVVHDPTSDAPLLSRRIAGPFAAGLHAIDLAAEGVVLRVGRDYEWSVSIPAGGSARDQDVVSLGAIRRVDSVDAVGGEAADEAARARRIHALAAAGDWYDAFDQADRWLEQAPELDRLRAYRRALLEQVDLARVAAWIEADPTERR
ncbi:MAG: DUF928 domain-containing protein [Myxococcota bacterium]